MSDIYSQLKIISDSDKSFNMTKDDAAIGLQFIRKLLHQQIVVFFPRLAKPRGI